MRSKLIGLLLAVALVTMTITIVNNNTKQTEQKLNRQIETLEHKTREQQKLEVENLKKEIETIKQSKAAEKAIIAAETAQKKATIAQKVESYVAPKAVASSLSDNDAKMFIYMHESGNRTTALNSIGCRGLGQACPGSKLPCGDDYACQDAWFTNYAVSRYGGWQGAYQFWIAHRWW